MTQHSISKYACVLSHFSHVQLFVTLWTVPYQASLSVRFFKQEYWSGLPFASPGYLPDPEIEAVSLASPALAGRFFMSSATWEACNVPWKITTASNKNLCINILSSIIPNSQKVEKHKIPSISSVQSLNRVRLLWPHGLQHARPPCPSPTPGVYSNSSHWVGDASQTSHPLSFPSPPAFNLSQYQGLYQWVSSSHHVAKALEYQLQHQSFQWIFRTDFL